MSATKVHYTFKQRSRGARELLEDIFNNYPFTKKQKKLLIALTTFKPTSVTELESKTKSNNIKSLVRDTNIRLRKNRYGEQIKIVSCFETLKIKGHYRLVFKPFSGYTF